MGICLVAILGTGLLCSSGGKPVVIDGTCTTMRIIHASRRDTPETLAQVRINNAKVRAHCPVKKK